MLPVSDLFPSDPERDARSRTMNRMIVAAARRGWPTGGVARLSGDTSAPLAAAFSNLEAAERSGDADAVAFAEHVLDTRLEAARAGRQSVEPEPPPVSFDGGFRGRRSPPASGGWADETPTQLMARALREHHSDRVARGADQRVIAVNT
jgi:hypothetical protein